MSRDIKTAISPEAADVRHVQIDGLRALAMIGVLYVHFWDDNPIAEHLRVSLFFVVSGFLITHILYAAKERGGTINVLNFYVRRALRLFPALLIFVVVAAAFDMDGFRTSALWHLFQLSNVYFSMKQDVTPWVAGHLWSLNVLEQFYLLCPLAVLLLSRRNVYLLAIAGLIAAIFLRVNMTHVGIDGWWSFFVFSFDPVLAGVLACLLAQDERVASALGSVPVLIASVLIVASPQFLWVGFGASESYRLLCLPALSAIVAGAFRGYRGPVGWLLASWPARFLSQISYGVYIYHLAIWWFIVQALPDLFNKGPLTFMIASLATGVAATVSWYLAERPISDLKRYFPTRAAAITEDVASTTDGRPRPAA